MKRYILRLIIMVLVLGGSLVVTPSSKPAQAACSNPASPYGVSTVTYTIPVAGTYRVWSRIQAPDTTNNSYYLQIDSDCAINVGDGTIAAGSLQWVDYQDGLSTSKITKTLTAGSHTFVLTGKEPGVMVDRVVFAVNQSCVPTGTGDNCADTATPTPTATATPTATPTPTATATPTPTPTPAGNGSDLNADSKVNVFDLSILLSHWGTSGVGDIDKNGTVNVFDLSRLLSAWTG